MEDESYKKLRTTLIDLLKDLEAAKKKCEQASQISRTINGPFRKEIEVLGNHFDQLAQNILKLEQETREF